MQRVEFTINHHDPVLSRFAIASSCVEVLDHKQPFSWQISQRGGKFVRGLYLYEVVSSVEARASKQQRKSKAFSGQSSFEIRGRKHLTRQHDRLRHDDIRHLGKTLCDETTPSGLHSRGVIDYWGLS